MEGTGNRHIDKLLAKSISFFSAHFQILVCLAFSFVILLTGLFASSFSTSVGNADTALFYSAYKDTSVWFATYSDEDDTFLNFNGCSFYYGEKNLSVDPLMTKDDIVYTDKNLFSVVSPLEHGTCTLGKNIAKECGISIGDSVKMRNGKSFTVVSFFASQNGIDSKYSHEGVLVLGYDEELVAEKDHSYLFFSDGNSFDFITGKVSFSNIVKNDAYQVLSSMLILFGFIVGLIVAEELFLSRSLRHDYALMKHYGRKKSSVFRIILLDLIFKYFVPSVLALCVFMTYAMTSLYGYILLCVVILLAMLLICLLLTFVNMGVKRK